MKDFSLAGKTICVTGASSGIGRQCAISCSRMGANLVLIARNEERLEETLSLMENKSHHLIISVDLTNFDKVKTVVEEIVKTKGKINGIVHCAGISTTLPLKCVKPDLLKEYFNANVFSAYNLTREFCRKRNFSEEGGSVIFISSIMAVVGENAKSLYSMTKGALLSGTRSLACELSKNKIRVNSVSPGLIVTPINQNMPHITDENKRKQLEQSHLLGLGKVEDVANACIFLLSDASRWVTGINLKVDGGYSAK